MIQNYLCKNMFFFQKSTYISQVWHFISIVTDLILFMSETSLFMQKYMYTWYSISCWNQPFGFHGNLTLKVYIRDIFICA